MASIPKPPPVPIWFYDPGSSRCGNTPELFTTDELAEHPAVKQILGMGQEQFKEFVKQEETISLSGSASSQSFSRQWRDPVVAALKLLRKRKKKCLTRVPVRKSGPGYRPLTFDILTDSKFQLKYHPTLVKGFHSHCERRRILKNLSPPEYEACRDTLQRLWDAKTHYFELEDARAYLCREQNKRDRLIKTMADYTAFRDADAYAQKVLPPNPRHYYSRKDGPGGWVDFTYFTCNFKYHTAFDTYVILRENQVTTMEGYKELRINDPRLPPNPEEYYTRYGGWTNEHDFFHKDPTVAEWKAMNCW